MAKRHAAGLLVALLAGAVISLSYFFGFFDTWQEKVFDRFYLTQPAPEKLFVIAIDDESIQAIGNWPWRREVFAQVLARLSGARAIGIDVAFTEHSAYGTGDDAALAAALREAPQAVLPVQFDDRGGKVTAPTAALGAENVGFVNVLVDADGVVRQQESERPPYTALSAKLAGVESYPSRFRIGYLGPTKTVTTIPFVDVYEGKVPETLFADAVVLIGATANDLHDFMGTPFGRMPGVEVHANSVATLQGAAFPTEVSKWLGVILILLLSFASFALVRLVRRFALLLGSFAALLFLILAISAGLFAIHILLPVLYLFVAAVLSSGSLVTLEYFTESKERRFIQKTFSYYLTPSVIDELLKDPSKLRLGGERRRLAILFSDIRGFTTISETLKAEELTQLMNEYLTAMTDIIMERRGLVDKYIGDAIMAFWGAPVANPESEKDACMAAVAMTAKLAECNARWQARGIPTLTIGIGINTGEVVVGNMGSEKRFNYTIMGDEVNFASRLEGITKSYGVSCVIGESTAEAVKGDSAFTLRELDLVRVKGKKEPKRIFELVTKPITPAIKEQLQHFAAGKREYAAGRFNVAAAHFKKALALGEDGPSAAFLERCESLQTNPPANWDGVYDFKTK